VIGSRLDGEEISCGMDNSLMKCDICHKDEKIFKIAKDAMGINKVKVNSILEG
jgi:hypothetical protein